MKKKLFAVLAATLAGATLSLSACTSGSSKITLKNYWNVNTDYTSNETIDETLTYAVSYESYESEAINYDLDYDGTYQTTLTWDATNNLYVFTSKLQIKATFTVGDESEIKEDDVYTVAYFHKAGGTDSLRPVYSYREITSHSPIATNRASTTEDCYERYDYKIETNYDNGQGKCTIIQEFYNKELDETLEIARQEKSFNATNKKYSVFDNEQFPVAFRAMPSGTNTKIQMYNPFLERSQNYKVSLSGDTKEKKYSYTLNGSTVEPTIHYHTASIAVDGTASGQAQWAEIATIQNEQANIDHRIMLAYYAPLSHNIGVLQYKLTTAQYK